MGSIKRRTFEVVLDLSDKDELFLKWFNLDCDAMCNHHWEYSTVGTKTVYIFTDPAEAMLFKLKNQPN